MQDLDPKTGLGALTALSAAVRFKQSGRLGLGYVVVGGALLGSGYLPKDEASQTVSASLVVGASAMLTLGLAQQAAEYSRGRNPLVAVTCGLGAVAAATATAYTVIDAAKQKGGSPQQIVVTQNLTPVDANRVAQNAADDIAATLKTSSQVSIRLAIVSVHFCLSLVCVFDFLLLCH